MNDISRVFLRPAMSEIKPVGISNRLMVISLMLIRRPILKKFRSLLSRKRIKNGS
jgi:hypothetical protein